MATTPISAQARGIVVILQGKAWVVGQPGNEYQISLRNQSGSDVLAVVSVDGVNVITGETAEYAARVPGRR